MLFYLHRPLLEGKDITGWRILDGYIPHSGTHRFQSNGSYRDSEHAEFQGKPREAEKSPGINPDSQLSFSEGSSLRQLQLKQPQ